MIPIGAVLTVNGRGAGIQQFASIFNTLCPDYEKIEESTQIYINKNTDIEQNIFRRDLGNKFCMILSYFCYPKKNQISKSLQSTFSVMIFVFL